MRYKNQIKDMMIRLNGSNKIILSLLDDWRAIIINKSDKTIIEERKSKFNGKDRICTFEITHKIQDMDKLETNPKVSYNFGIVLSKLLKSKADDKCLYFLNQNSKYIKIICI